MGYWNPLHSPFTQIYTFTKTSPDLRYAFAHIKLKNF